MSTAIQYRGGTTVQHATFTGKLREITVNTDNHHVVVHDGATAGGFPLARYDLVRNSFVKADPTTVCFAKTGFGTVSTSQQIYADVVGLVIPFASGTAVVMPALTAGTDYAIYACTDGTIRADSNFTAPTGYTAANSRQIGGFHYAPGANAAAQAGGDTTPQINQYSFWDLNFRPACADPRGMALVTDFWADIYLCAVNHLTGPTSQYNAAIATGGAPPKRSTLFGGDGTVAYPNGDWWNFAEVMKQHGKRLPAYDEFAALAYGTTEATSMGGTGVTTTGANGAGATSAWNIFTSKWGINQATGCVWVWGNDFVTNTNVTGNTVDAITDGRGSVYEFGANSVCAVLLGGLWSNAAYSGSRASDWGNSPSNSSANVGARGVCDHLILV